jgi:hypothetical protein
MCDKDVEQKRMCLILPDRPKVWLCRVPSRGRERFPGRSEEPLADARDSGSQISVVHRNVAHPAADGLRIHGAARHNFIEWPCLLRALR